MATETDGGLEALQRLKSIDPPLYLTPSLEISKDARLASQFLFSSLRPFVSKSPFSNLLTEGFDAEQVWQQIDLQSQPLLSSLRRHVRDYEKNPLEIRKQFNLEKPRGNKEDSVRDHLENGEAGDEQRENDDFDNDDDDEEDKEDEEEDKEEEEEEDDDDDDDDDDDEDEDEDGGMENEGMRNVNGVEDRFLKLNELEKYLEEDEVREFGNKEKKDVKRKRSEPIDDDDDEDEDEEDEDDEEELGLMDLGDEDGDGNKMDNARYEDFFGVKRTGQKKKSTQYGGTHGSYMDGEPVKAIKDQGKQILSTHEKEQESLRSEIEKLERANIEPKSWTMQGEVTASKRPKNSALEADLDFEHNVRPAPVITEEVTASLEELIKKRVIEARFDDVQKPPTLSHKAPREKIELDETKSKKGLAEVYEDEYAKKTGLVSTALSFSDEQKKEATMLFKRLCLRLDALAHFHFTPKPIIEDMSIQVNVPALAMEEIAPLAVSDAAMLAPEEVFAGKRDAKEETELTKVDRKRRRAKKKRKFKAISAKQTIIKTPQQKSTPENHDNGNKTKLAT